VSTPKTPSAQPFAHLPLAPVWASPFRPFGAAGMAYGVVLMTAWLLARQGVIGVPGGVLTLHDWHSHEMVFGFAVAIICATVLTALPSWAGTPEIRGARLSGLVALWLLGRAAFAAYGLLPLALVIPASVALQAALIVLVAPDLLRLDNRYYLLLLVILAGMLAGDVLFLSGHVDAGLRTGLYAIVLTFALKAGVFAPIFTGNHLRATRRGDQAPFLLPLEFAAVGAIFVLAAVDLAGAPPSVRALAAFAAAAIHLVRLVRWRGWLVLDIPLLWTMHVAYAWMVVAFLLMGVGHLGVGAAASVAWHAFVVGSLGSMMLGLMTRVALRHTGRRLVPPPLVVGAYWLIQLAAVLRVAAPFFGSGDAWIVTSGSAWIAAFAIYLACFGRILLSPSLPRGAAAPAEGVVKDMSDVR
jgi:uncharacterized protein involved in response to NO